MSDKIMPGEFELIKRHLAPLSAKEPGAFSLTDDAAVLPSRAGLETVITMDTLVSGVHFLETTAPEYIAAKAVRVNLSDLAAMGAQPAAYTLSLALPKPTQDGLHAQVDGVWLERFCEALAVEQELFGVTLIGGDTVGTPGPLTLTITAIGYVEQGQAIRRSTARVGDLVVVSGTIGDAAYGLLALKGEMADLSEPSLEILIERHHRPRPQIGLGRSLRNFANAAIDVSDGLVQDLGHICSASGVSAVIELEKVPVSAALDEAIRHSSHVKSDILSGGDDYQLLFTVPPEREGGLKAISKEHDVNLSVIGKIHKESSSSGALIVIDHAGVPLDIVASGFHHF